MGESPNTETPMPLLRSSGGEATSMLKMLTERAYSDISSQEPTTYMITVPKVISVLRIQVLYSPLWAPPRATCS